MLGFAEHDLQHELALRIVLERVGRELVLEHVTVEHADDLAAVDRDARQAVRCPSDDSLREPRSRAASR